MAEELRLNIVSTADSKGLDKAAKDLAETKAQADDLGVAFNDAGKDAEKFTASLEDHAEQMRVLQIEYERTTASIKKLDAQLIAGGRDDAELKKSLRAERAWLAELKRIRRDLDDKDSHNLFNAASMAASAATAGVKAGTSFASGFTDALDKVPVLKTALVAGAVSVVAEAMPLIGALVGGVFTGGVGTVALAAGIASTARDPRVQAAARTAGSTIADNFFAGSDAFVQPTVDALHSLSRTFASLDVGGSLAKVAPTVATITNGLERLFTNVMPGVNRTLDRLGPFADVAAQGFADLGSVIGKFADDVSSSEGSVEGLAMAFKLLNGTINILGTSIHWLEDRFHDWLGFNDKALAAAETLARALGQQGVADAIRQARFEFAEIMNDAPRVGQGVRGVGDAAGYFAGEASKAATAGQNLANAWNQLHGKKLNADEAMLAAIEAAERVKEVFASGGKGLSGDSKVAVENRVAIEQAAKLAVEAATKYVEMTGDIAGAEKKLKDLQAQTEKNTGATGNQKKAVHDLATELFALPAEVTSTVTTINRTFYQEYRAGERSPTGRASGGPVVPGMTYMINERARETVTFPAQGIVHPASLSPLGGMGNTRPLVIAPTGNPFTDAAFEWLRNEVSARGGTLAVLGLRG